MNLLNAIFYQPTVAASISTASVTGMNAIDTTNLRLNVTVPAHGMVRFIMQCAVSGATTFPQVLLGLMVGVNQIARQAPLAVLGGTALATTRLVLLADFTLTGLTPGATDFDAAVGVEIAVASTAIRYGGPYTAIANDAWGGFRFEAWDPQPQSTNAQLAVDNSGRVTAGTVSDKTGYSLSGNQSFNNTGNLTGSVTGSVGSVVGSVGGNVVGSVASVTAPVTVGTNNDKTGYSLTQAFPSNFANLTIAVGGAVTAGTVSDKTGYSLASTQAFNLTGNITGNLSGSVGSVSGNVTVGTNNDKTGYSLSGNQSFNNTGNLTGSVTGSVGSVVGNVGGNVTGSIGSVTSPVTVGTNNDKTGYALTSTAYNDAADALLNRDMSLGTDSGSSTDRTPRQAFRALRNRWDNTGGTYTVYKEDDSTVSWTSAVATTPGADPITGSDPAGP